MAQRASFFLYRLENEIMSKTLVKAIRVHAHGGPEVLKVEDVALAAPGPKEVTIRHHAVGLNYIDTYFRSGLYPHALPHGLGFEAAGIVQAVGAEVAHVKAGDRVAYGQCPIGAYAQAHNVPAAQVVKLPLGVSFEEGAALMLKGLTVQYLFRQTYRLQGNETILFHAAAGGVGLLACQWARALGVKLIGTVSSPEKAAIARENGAWETIDYSRENVAERVLELTKGQKVPVVYDGVGKDTWETSLDCISPRGLMVSFGNSSGSVSGVNLAQLNQKGCLYVTRPSLGLHVNTYEKLAAAANEMFDLVAQNKIQVRIDQRFTLADAAKAHIALESRKTTGATVLSMD